MSETRAIADVIFREDLYPRIKTNPEKVQQYAEDLEVLPPIEINQNNELIDGWHRWTAYKKKQAETIPVIVTETDSDEHLLELAIRRNAIGLMQLSIADKKRLARRYYRASAAEEHGEKKRWIAELLQMSYDTIHRWLSRIDKDSEEERHVAVQNLWLQGYTQDEIAKAVGWTQQNIEKLIQRIRKYEIVVIPGLFIEDQPEDSASERIKREWETARQEKIVRYNQDIAEHAADFAVPIYNIWKQQNKTEGIDHFGNSEVRWVDNLLYLYTQPFNLVVDPFAGGGSTLDICKKRFRRCWISDHIPIEERQKEIRKLDLVTDGLPDLRKRWSDVRLVYLDPPYWKQSKSQYSNDPTDLANMPLEQFHEILAGLIKAFAKKLSNAYIALIIQPTQWNAPEHQFTDHIGEMLRVVSLPVDMRYSVPYESQQCNAQMVEWAKENKRCLVLTREIIVWRIHG